MRPSFLVTPSVSRVRRDEALTGRHSRKKLLDRARFSGRV